MENLLEVTSPSRSHRRFELADKRRVLLMPNTHTQLESGLWVKFAQLIGEGMKRGEGNDSNLIQHLHSIEGNLIDSAEDAIRISSIRPWSFRL